MQRNKSRLNRRVRQILVCDPSLTAWGCAVVSSSGSVIYTEAIKTESSHKKLRIRKSDDTGRRIAEIVRRLNYIITKYNVSYIAAEAPHGAQNYNGAVTIGLCLAILEAIHIVKEIPLEWYSEADAKKAIKEKDPVTKKEMVRLIDKNYNVDWANVEWKDQAVADAIAIFHVASKTSPVLQYMQNDN